MKSNVAERFLAALAHTANERDYAAHMDLISQKVQVFGVPGFEVIDYNDWANQCRHEFEQGLLKRVSYDGMKVVTMTPGRVMFKTMETVEATDGTANTNGVEIMVEKERDGRWRVVQERVLPPEEIAFDRRSEALY